MNSFLTQFLNNLIECEDLIDIGKKGVASQSSVSEFSYEDDAQRALMSLGEQVNYSFHTKTELRPWWQVSFDNPEYLKYIIINNRRDKPFDSRAIHISVNAIDIHDNEILLHQGLSYFGSLPTSLPLIIHCNSKQKIKIIRIQLLGKKPRTLHLSDIHLLRKKTLQEKNNCVCIFSNRSDGFGERLRSLLNAMAVADKLNGKYFFTWSDGLPYDSQFHAIQNANLCFSKDFLDKHLVDDMQQVGDNYLDYLELNHFLGGKNLGDSDGYVMHQGNFLFKNDFFTLKNDDINYAYYFKKIGFSALLSQVFDDVDEMFDGNNDSVGIHVRMGDLVYGNHRLSNIYYDKCVPIYVLDALVDYYKSKKFQVFLFGDNENFCHSYANEKGILYSGNLYDDNYDKNQKALFDILLLSRCQEIVAGSSGFAILASWIGNSRIVKYKDLVSDIKIAEEFNLKNLDKDYADDLLQAFTVSHFLYYYANLMDYKTKISLIDYASGKDKENLLYFLMKISFLYEEELFLEGDHLLCKVMKRAELSDYLKRTGFNNKKSAISKFIDNFYLASDNGSILASLLILLYEYYCLGQLNHINAKELKKFIDDGAEYSEIIKFWFNQINFV